MRRDVEARLVAPLLGKAAVDEGFQLELRGPLRGVVLPAGTPEQHPDVPGRQVRQQVPVPRPQRRAGERVDQRAVDVEDPAAGLQCQLALSIVPACGGQKSLSVYSIPDEEPLGPAAGILVRRRRPPRNPGHRGVPLRSHAVLRGAGRPGAPAGARLRAQGLEAGDIIAYALPNDADIVMWQLAAQEGGFQSISLNPALSGAEIQRIVDHSGAAAVVLHADYADRADRLTGTGSIRLRVAVGGAIPGWASYESIVEGHPQTEPADRRLGHPHLVFVGHHRAAQGRRAARVPRRSDPSVAADRAKSFGHAFQFLPYEGVHLVSAGMHHGGCQGFYLGALNVGQALAIVGRFDAEQSLAMIERHRVTTAYMVPTQFVRFLRLPEATRSRYDVSSLQVVVHSAAPCPLEVKKQMMEWWGPVIWETYGGMEGAATIAKPYRWLEKPGTVGRSVAGMKVKILDDEGRELPRGRSAVSTSNLNAGAPSPTRTIPSSRHR